MVTTVYSTVEYEYSMSMYYCRQVVDAIFFTVPSLYLRTT